MGQRMIRRLSLIASTVALAAMFAVPSVLAADGSVTIANFAFDPGSLTVRVGDTVTWTNQDSAPHTATADDGTFDTGRLTNGGSKGITFSKAGTFSYHCAIHAAMIGTIVVQAAAGGITPAPTDTLASATGATSDSPAFLAVLAGLGAMMLVGTVVADRQLRARRRSTDQPD